ncbi:MAG: hypothetical protein A4S09_16615 [Proteobacteria bacterium SG_bin7]|nr:MAG: hypothetical protein A4S09_16615 [Proteobacteria bacterium SG_bin7]
MKASSTLGAAPDSVFRIWRNRLRIEYEAAALFAQLGKELAQHYGKHDEVVRLCEGAEEEELSHAKMCIEIIKYSGEAPAFNYTRKKIQLGPENLTSEQKILYTSLALSCVTETLSTALLTEMQNAAEPGLIKDTVHQILRDEVKHSRIGWAELNRCHQNQNLTWVQPYIPLMLKEALQADIQPMLTRQEAKDDLSAWGILSPLDASLIMENTITQIISPGLQRYGLKI